VDAVEEHCGVVTIYSDKGLPVSVEFLSAYPKTSREVVLLFHDGIGLDLYQPVRIDES
jgi:hypothetical protein